MRAGKHLIFFLATGLSLAGYYFLGYETDRHEVLPMVIWYCILFVSYIYFASAHKYYKWSLWASFAFKLVLLFAVPALSTDFFRFLWDGQLLTNGLNPYVFTPDAIVSANPELENELYHSLAYTSYHSMYAPVAQVQALIAAWIASDNIQLGSIILRLFVLAAEVCSILLIIRLLPVFRLNRERVLLYAANPLIILELTGNLHHEAFVILFTLLFIYLFEKRKIFASGAALGLGVLSKLLPMIFLPVLVRRVGLRFILLVAGVLIVVILGFLPFINQELISGHLESGALYFNKLEFNGSVYFIVRKIGFWYKGYNIIQTAGPWLGIAAFTGILLYALMEKPEHVHIAISMMWVWMIYVSFTTTLHPWYVTPLVALCVFSNYRFPMVWSFLIFFTYLGYTSEGYRETPFIFFAEYVLTLGWMFYEISLYSRKNQVVRLSGRRL